MEKYLENIVVSSVKVVKERPKKIFIIIATPILILSSINMLDFFIFPKEFFSDKIVSNNKIYRPNSGREVFGGHQRVFVGYQYETEKGLSFTLSKAFIPEKDIDVEHTQIFKTVTFVDSDRKDYTNKLTSNLNGILKYFHFIFFASLCYGIVTFLYDKSISNNKFLNILIFNSIMFCILLYMLIFN